MMITVTDSCSRLFTHRVLPGAWSMICSISPKQHAVQQQAQDLAGAAVVTPLLKCHHFKDLQRTQGPNRTGQQLCFGSLFRLLPAACCIHTMQVSGQLRTPGSNMLHLNIVNTQIAQEARPVAQSSRPAATAAPAAAMLNQLPGPRLYLPPLFCGQHQLLLPAIDDQLPTRPIVPNAYIPAYST